VSDSAPEDPDFDLFTFARSVRYRQGQLMHINHGWPAGLLRVNGQFEDAFSDEARRVVRILLYFSFRMRALWLIDLAQRSL
jgi:hypothetical protein